MTVVLRLWGNAATGPTPDDGQYLKGMDFEAHDGRGEMLLTHDLQRAMKFDDLRQAWEFWQRSPKCHPLRQSDGKPNRPLTAFNWEFETLAEAKRAAR